MHGPQTRAFLSFLWCGFFDIRLPDAGFTAARALC